MRRPVRILEEARRIAPQNTLVIEACGWSLLIEERLDEAIDLVRRVPSEALSYQGQMIFGMMLMKRGDPGDCSDVGETVLAAGKKQGKTAGRFPGKGN